MDQPERSSGILLHVSSLPGPYGIGDLGPPAYRFADFLAHTGQRIWQVLPLVPVGLGNSPYSSPSTFAGNPLFISPDLLLEQGLLDAADLAHRPTLPSDHVDFGAAIPYKHGLLEKAFHRFGDSDRAQFDRFCDDNAYWLDDYALFMALKKSYEGAAWTTWPAELAGRRREVLDHARTEHAEEIRRQKFWQFLFASQWDALKSYCNERQILMFGDIPIYVAHDSADVWAHPDLFYLDERGAPTVVSGVPPDYFSKTGQRWGNPLYRWDLMREKNYEWWTRRFEHSFTLMDVVRLDHFRAFAGYWEIPASEETAIHGRWVEGPGASLFTAVQSKLGPLPVVAENLGLITDDVTELMERFDFPGMAVLQFAFDEDAGHSFLPHNFDHNLVAYTGTHDNDTLVGWWTQRAAEWGSHEPTRRQAYANDYLGFNESEGQGIHWGFIRALESSVARMVVIPMQDVLGLGSEARMNTPGLGEGNWTWRFTQDMLTEEVARNLRGLTEVYGRAPWVYPRE